MEDLPDRVNVLQGRVAEHHQVLFGPEDCPEVGLVKQFDVIKTLVTKQVVYNKIMTFIAGAITLAVITYVMSLIFGM
jgi:hypothetical protein